MSFRKTTYTNHWRVPGGAMFAIMILLVTGCISQSQSDEATIERGQLLYAENCQSCHGDAKTGENAVLGTPVHGPEGHTWHHADGLLTEVILGRLDYPGRTMPSFANTLSEEDVTAILTYLKSNWEADQLEFQAEASKNWEELQGNSQ